MAIAVKPRIAILGAGFGGLNAARALAKADVEITLIDRQNHHLFQPLLYQVATATLSPADIAAPIRSVVKKHKNIKVLLDTVEGISPEAKTVQLQHCGALDYDYLVIATGARHSYLGNDMWEDYAPGLKTIDDATKVRREVLIALEYAEIETDKASRDALLTFVVIGGGPTGVEMAGAIAELARSSVSMDFRSITPHCSRVILIDSGDRLLKSFPESLSAAARKSLESLGVEIYLGRRISEIQDHGVKIGDEWVMAQTVVWAAGVRASPAARWLGITPAQGGRVPVCAGLMVAGFPDIYAIGDTASCPDASGAILPGVAPVAKQQGRHVAKAIIARLNQSEQPQFRYRNYGNLATIGRKRAVADFGRFRLSGFAAWLLWCVIHIMFLANFRNRLVVGMRWFWNYVTFERNARLITGIGGEKAATLVMEER